MIILVVTTGGGKILKLFFASQVQDYIKVRKKKVMVNSDITPHDCP